MTVKFIFHFEITYNYIQTYTESGLDYSGLGLSPDFCTTLGEEKDGLRGQSHVDSLSHSSSDLHLLKVGVPGVCQHTWFIRC